MNNTKKSSEKPPTKILQKKIERWKEYTLKHRAILSDRDKLLLEFKILTLVDIANQSFSRYADLQGWDEKSRELRIEDLNNRFINSIFLLKDCFDSIKLAVDDFNKDVYRKEIYLFSISLICSRFARSLGFFLDENMLAESDINEVIRNDYLLTRIASSAMGYWTAKVKKSGNNPGAEAMKKKREKNTKAIEDIVRQLQINDTGLFRKDKKRRENFFALVKKNSSLLSEDRILKITRSLLTVKAVP